MTLVCHSTNNHEFIAITEAVRDLTCQRLLGALANDEYREKLASLLDECGRRFPPHHLSDDELLMGEGF